MAVKRFFTKNKERVGKKSGKPRGKYKKRDQLEQVILEKQQAPIITKLKKQELTSISRKITEKLRNFTITPPKRFSWKMAGFLAFFLLVLGVSVWQAVAAVEKLAYLQSVVAKRVKLTQEMKLWVGIATKYPTYRDAYFQAAVLAYQLGEKEKEKQYVHMALSIDPNYEPAKSLEKLQ